MRIIVLGAGVLGSLYAARLKEAGHQVAVLARGKRLEELREHGVVIEDARTGRRSAARVEVVEALEPEDRYDLAIVLVRKNQVGALLPALGANRGTPDVLFMVNNAAGPDEYLRALEKERVLLGFPGAGGERVGHVVRAHVLSGRSQPTTLGEVEGGVTPRLRRIGRAFQQAGFPVEYSRNMDAWLKTHVALVSPIANALYMMGGDNYRLADSPDGLRLMVRAIREGFRVLRALGIPITPRKYAFLLSLPLPVLLPALRLVFGTRQAELVMARHANAARDEMKHLADEFRALARRATIPTPAIDELYMFIER